MRATATAASDVARAAAGAAAGAEAGLWYATGLRLVNAATDVDLVIHGIRIGECTLSPPTAVTPHAPPRQFDEATRRKQATGTSEKLGDDNTRGEATGLAGGGALPAARRKMGPQDSLVTEVHLS